MPTQQESQIPQSTLQSPTFNSSSLDKKKSPKKTIIAIISILVLVGAVIAGVMLVKRQQELREFASSAAECTHSPDCVVFENPGNEGYREVDRCIEKGVFTSKPGQERTYNQGSKDDGCYEVKIENNKIHWKRKEDSKTCKDISNIQIWFNCQQEPTSAPTPTTTTMEFVKICHYTSESAHPWQAIEVSTIAWEQGHDDAHDFKKTEYDFLYENNDPNCAWPDPGNEGITCADEWCNQDTTPTPTTTQPTLTPTDVPPEITAVCNEVKVYDTSWNLLSSNDLKQLKPGDKIRFTVSGSTTQGSIEKARFTINGNTSHEVIGKKPGTEEFYLEYEIPDGQLSFSVTGEIYHSTIGWF